jgi:hypothetical protein
MLTEKGAPATITKLVTTSIAVSTDTPTSYTLSMGVVAVVLPASGSQADSFDTKALIRQKYRLVYFSAPVWTFLCVGGETLNFGDGEWVLSGVSPLAPDSGSPIMYTANAERV